MCLQEAVNLGRERLQGENHKGYLVRVWIEFMFAAEKRTTRELTFLRGLKRCQGHAGRSSEALGRSLSPRAMGNLPEILIGTVLPADRLMVF